MPSSTLPRSSGNPIWGHRLSSANTCPPSCTSSTGRWRPCTTSRPLALRSSRLPARTKSEVVLSIGVSPDDRPRQHHSAGAFLECQSSEEGRPAVGGCPPYCRIDGRDEFEEMCDCRAAGASAFNKKKLIHIPIAAG